MFHDVYPEGVADIVSYSAEDRILGGVVVFEGRLPEDTRCQKSTVTPAEKRGRFAFYQLRDDQQRSPIEFLLSDEQSNARKEHGLLRE